MNWIGRDAMVGLKGLLTKYLEMMVEVLQIYELFLYVLRNIEKLNYFLHFMGRART